VTFHGLVVTFNVTVLAPEVPGQVAAPHQLHPASRVPGAETPFTPTSPFPRTPIFCASTRPAPLHEPPSNRLFVMVAMAPAAAS